GRHVISGRESTGPGRNLSWQVGYSSQTGAEQIFSCHRSPATEVPTEVGGRAQQQHSEAISTRARAVFYKVGLIVRPSSIFEAKTWLRQGPTCIGSLP